MLAETAVAKGTPMNKTDIIIIGGGPAGITFSRKLKKLKADREVTMFRPEAHSMVYCAGAIGIEQAQAYQARGIETWLIDMAPHALPNMVDADMSAPLHEAMQEKGVHLVFEAKVEALKVTDAGVSQVHLSNGDTIDLDPEKDFVCFAVGMKPDVDLFKDSTLEMTRDGIVVDTRMQTNIPDVLAVGDCCTFYSAIDEKALGGKLATNAAPMAKIDVITLAIQRRMTLKGLSKLSYSAQPWQSFFPARSAIVEACENALDNFAAKGEPFHYPDLVEWV